MKLNNVLKSNVNNVKELRMIALVTLNSKYLHPSPSLKILSNDLNNNDIDHKVYEYTIKEDLDIIVKELSQYKVIAFSCYIYNIEKTKYILTKLKSINKDITIILGGPEVSYINVEQALILQFDYIICGEGEYIFKELVSHIVSNKHYDHPALIYKYNDQLKMNTTIHYAPVTYVSELINDFSNVDISNQIVYLETSRGCPYQCSYCQASLDNNVRDFDLKQILHSIKNILNQKAKIVKLLDRTFNFNIKRTNEIIDYIMLNDNDYTTFQFEITGELFDDSSLELIKNARPNLFRFEIGIQSTNLQSNRAIRRYQNFDKLSSVINKIQSNNNIVLHLDLISGLPFEDLQSFKVTFDTVFNLRAKEIQLGVLKLLPGTHMNDIIEEYYYKFNSIAPYELIENKWLSKDDLALIERVEHTLNAYYNSGKALSFIQFYCSKYHFSPFALFSELGQVYYKKMSVTDMFILITKTYRLDDNDVIVLYRDYYRNTKTKLHRLSQVEDKKQVLHEVIKKYHLIQNNVFSYFCVEKISDNKYYCYDIKNKKEYII